MMDRRRKKRWSVMCNLAKHIGIRSNIKGYTLRELRARMDMALDHQSHQVEGEHKDGEESTE